MCVRRSMTRPVVIRSMARPVVIRSAAAETAANYAKTSGADHGDSAELLLPRLHRQLESHEVKPGLHPPRMRADCNTVMTISSFGHISTPHPHHPAPAPVHSFLNAHARRAAAADQKNSIFLRDGLQ